MIYPGDSIRLRTGQVNTQAGRTPARLVSIFITSFFLRSRSTPATPTQTATRQQEQARRSRSPPGASTRSLRRVEHKILIGPKDNPTGTGGRY